MSAEMFLKELDRIAEAPDAIARLRLLIVDLAIRGRLTERRSDEEPALLSLQRAHPGAQVQTMAGPFELPDSWVWLEFGDLATFAAGHTPSRNDPALWNTGEHAWATIRDMPDGGNITTTKETVSATAKDRVFKSEPVPVGTMLMSFKLTIGKIARLGLPAYHNEAIMSIHPTMPEMDPYLFLVLPERARRGTTIAAVKGATLNRNSLTKLLIPVPPLAEQDRIVAKVDQLMGVCDELQIALEAAQRQRGLLLDALLHDALREESRLDMADDR